MTCIIELVLAPLKALCEAGDVRVASLPAACGTLIALAVVATASRAAAVDPFEIQVYDGTANAPGVPGLELHLNEWATGHRDAATPPELPLHGQFHATLEPSFGVLPWWELGGYLQTAVRADGTFDYAGVKFRSKFVTPRASATDGEHWRFGLNLELSILPSTYDHDRWGTEIRPIVAWQSEAWLFAFNPILDQPLAGGDASAGPSFEPALKVARTVGPIALGLEYYAAFGPLSAPLPWQEQEHYVYEVMDLLSVEHFELNAGIGEGLTRESAGIVVKVILGYEFETSATPQPLTASKRAAR
jgi:hypothetical protein